MKVYLTYENITQSIAQVLISAWEKNLFVKKLVPWVKWVDKTKSQRKTVSSLHLAITKHDMEHDVILEDLIARKLVSLILDVKFSVL